MTLLEDNSAHLPRTTSISPTISTISSSDLPSPIRHQTNPIEFNLPRISAMANQPRGSIHFPLPGSRPAPRQFKGKYNEVKSFLEHYERLCAQFYVTDPREKLENIGQYAVRLTREFMEALDSFREGDWEQFTLDLLEYYDAERDEKRYSWRDLEAYAKKYGRSLKKVDLAYWKNYSWGFIRISGWLSYRNKISDREQALYFWKGIPRSFRQKLESRLIATHPDHDMEEPFDVEDIQRAAKSLLKRNRFDSDKLWSDDEQGSDDDQDSDSEFHSGSNIDSEEESESDYHSKKSLRKRSQKPHRSSHRSEKRDERSPHKDSKTVSSTHKTVAKTKDKEVEEIIGKLNRMSLDDPAYAIQYFWAYQLNPIIANIVPKPIERSKGSFQPRPNNIMNRNREGMIHNNPPHTSPNHEASVHQRPPPMGGRNCFGCGGSGHSIAFCPAITDMVEKGIVKRNGFGKLVFGDGSPIYRMDGEPFEAAIKRLRSMQANFVTAIHNSHDIPMETYDCEYISDEGSSDDEIYVATRSQGFAKERRRDFNGVYPPARKQHEDKHPRFQPKDSFRKENIPPPASSQVKRSTPPKKVDEPPVKPPKPVVVDQPRFDPNDSDAFMEDEAISKPMNSPVTMKTPRIDNEDSRVILKRIPRKSEVQSQVDQMNVLGRILSQPVTLAVGEVFGISKELTHHLQDVLKPKNPTVPATKALVPSGKVNNVSHDPYVATTFVSKSRGTLIRLRMECDGTPVQAIIDTGSQLNIAHKRVWKSVLARPIDMHKIISMSDANGGESMLKGLVPNVPLSCGGVLTHANVYIGDQVPFDLLLGRPWQRGNYVSIDERGDGTYLLFKDKNLEVRHEILVAPDNTLTQVDPEVAEFIDKTHYVHPRVALIEHNRTEDTNVSGRITELSELHTAEEDQECPVIIPKASTTIDFDYKYSTSPPSLQSTTRNENECSLATISNDEGQSSDDDMPELESISSEESNPGIEDDSADKDELVNVTKPKELGTYRPITRRGIYGKPPRNAKVNQSRGSQIVYDSPMGTPDVRQTMSLDCEVEAPESTGYTEPGKPVLSAVHLITNDKMDRSEELEDLPARMPENHERITSAGNDVIAPLLQPTAQILISQPEVADQNTRLLTAPGLKRSRNEENIAERSLRSIYYDDMPWSELAYSRNRPVITHRVPWPNSFEFKSVLRTENSEKKSGMLEFNEEIPTDVSDSEGEPESEVLSSKCRCSKNRHPASRCRGQLNPRIQKSASKLENHEVKLEEPASKQPERVSMKKVSEENTSLGSGIPTSPLSDCLAPKETKHSTLRVRGGCSGSDDGGDPFQDLGTTYERFSQGQRDNPNLPEPTKNISEFERRYPFSYWQSQLGLVNAMVSETSPNQNNGSSQFENKDAKPDLPWFEDSTQTSTGTYGSKIVLPKREPRDENVLEDIVLTDPGLGRNRKYEHFKTTRRARKRSNRSSSPEVDKPPARRMRQSPRLHQDRAELLSGEVNGPLKEIKPESVSQVAATYLVFGNTPMENSPKKNKGTPEIVGYGPQTCFPFSPSMKGDEETSDTSSRSEEDKRDNEIDTHLTPPAAAMPLERHRRTNPLVRFIRRPFETNFTGDLGSLLRRSGRVAPLGPNGAESFQSEVNRIISSDAPGAYQLTLTSGATRYFGSHPLPNGTHLHSFVVGPAALAIRNPQDPNAEPILTEVFGVTSLVPRPQTTQEVDIAEFQNNVGVLMRERRDEPMDEDTDGQARAVSQSSISDRRIPRVHVTDLPVNDRQARGQVFYTAVQPVRTGAEIQARLDRPLTPVIGRSTVARAPTPIPSDENLPPSPARGLTPSRWPAFIGEFAEECPYEDHRRCQNALFDELQAFRTQQHRFPTIPPCVRNLDIDWRHLVRQDVEVSPSVPTQPEKSNPRVVESQDDETPVASDEEADDEYVDASEEPPSSREPSEDPTLLDLDEGRDPLAWDNNCGNDGVHSGCADRYVAELEDFAAGRRPNTPLAPACLRTGSPLPDVRPLRGSSTLNTDNIPRPGSLVDGQPRTHVPLPRRSSAGIKETSCTYLWQKHLGTRPIPSTPSTIPQQRSPLSQVTNIVSAQAPPSPPRSESDTSDMFIDSLTPSHEAAPRVSSEPSRPEDRLAIPLPGGPVVNVEETARLLQHARERFSATPPPSSATPSTSSGAPSHSSAGTIEPYDSVLDYTQIPRPPDFIVVHDPTPEPTPEPTVPPASPTNDLPQTAWVSHVLREMQIDALLFFRHFFRGFLDSLIAQFIAWMFLEWEKALYNAPPETSSPEIKEKQV
ncbi:hypothetical protein QCA50_014933 [Cerrena zonata]|uniref:DUF4100 domain-containing protein n=1 Tax=Cerrena zonata TaxID=2478898 RepID=A0AAW0FYX0_9APHY